MAPRARTRAITQGARGAMVARAVLATLGLLVLPSLLAGVAVATTSCVTAGETVADDLEKPRYTLLGSDGAFSLRRYEPYVVAQTIVDEADMDQASRAGFRRLAGYIFGGNQGRRSIAMTAPVTSQATASARGERIAMTAPVGATREAAGWRVTFMMPGQYTLATLPVPDDQRVTFAQVPGADRAVVTFSWLTSDDRVQAQTAGLRSWLKARGLVERGAPVVARYNDPFTLPWNRTNEIWIDVESPAPVPTNGVP
jgi:hypothetical protein